MTQPDFSFYEGIISENPQEKEKYVQIILAVNRGQVKDSTKRWINVSGEVLLMLEKEENLPFL